MIEFAMEHRCHVEHDMEENSLSIRSTAQVKLFNDFIREAQGKTVEALSRTRRLMLIRELPHVYIA